MPDIKIEDVPPEFRINFPLKTPGYLIDGKLCEWSGPVEDVLSPVYIDGNPAKIGSAPMLDQQTSLEALDSAVRAYDLGRGPWPAAKVQTRIRHISNFATGMLKLRSEIVNLLMWEIGKSLKDSTKEFDRTIQYIQDTIDALKDLDRVSSRPVVKSSVIAQIRRSPLGVVLCMGPFNYPLNETFTTLIPALIMGNTVVLKPPKYGMMLFAPLLEILKESFPPGVINVIYGDGPTVIGPLMRSGKVDVLAFIGTSRVAGILKKEHPKPHRLRCVLGLEAKNPAIVLPDADLDTAVSECLKGSLAYNGQRCTAIKIIFVHKSLVKVFNEKFTKAINGLHIGLPWQPDVDITPLPETGKPQWLGSLLKDAADKNAKVLNEGGGLTSGSIFHPAALYPVDNTMTLWHDEQFGPIVPIADYTDLDEPLSYIADSPYGQQCSVFGSDPKTLGPLIDALSNQVSRVNLNARCQRGPDVFPFTGRKDSAEGTLSVTDALKVFSIRTMFATNENERNKSIVTDILEQNSSNFLSTDFIF